MLVVAVLWAAAPALACLNAKGQPACCQGMAMEHSCSLAMMSSSGCCKVQPEAAVLPPVPANLADPAVALAQDADAALPRPSATPQGAMLLASEISPPLGPPGAGSILRV